MGEREIGDSIGGKLRQIPEALLNRAKELRRSQTPAEEILWECLRDKRLNGFKFRRQHNIGQYIADFYCHEAKLAIEIDGEIHQTQRERDAERDRWMQKHKLTILRLQNHQIQHDLHNSLQVILSNLLPPSPQGEGLGVRANIFALTWDKSQPLSEFAQVFHSQSFLMPQSALKADGWQLENTQVLDLLAKLRNAGKPLEEITGKICIGIKTGFNEAFIIDRKVRDKLIAEHSSSNEVIKPFLRGRDVKKWDIEYQDIWIIFTRKGVDMKKYPAIEKYLSQYRNRLTAGAEGGRKAGSYQWYEIQDNVAYWQDFEKATIIFPDIAPSCRFTYCKEVMYVDMTAFIIPTQNLYVLGILNSTIAEYFISLISSSVRGDYLRFKRQYVSQIPIPTAPEAEQKAIESLVQKCLDAKGQNVTQWEQEIDEIVARLYGLSDDEIQIIKGVKHE